LCRVVMLLLVGLLPAGGAYVWSQADSSVPDGLPRIVPDSYAVRVGATNEPLPLDTFIRAALAFSGVDGADLAASIERVDDIRLEFSREAADIEDAYTLGRSILQFLHSEVFSRYSEPQTRLDTLLEMGTYNCVSSAVFYAILAKEADLPIRGVVTTDHAFCAVKVGDRWVDVETTTKFGFEPGAREEFQDAFGNTGFSYVPPGHYGKRTNIGEKALVALILQNRIAVLQRAFKFEESVGLSADRYAVVGSPLTRREMFNEFANYGALLNEERKYPQATAFIQAVADVYGPHETMMTLSGVVSHNWILEYLKAGEIAAARQLYDSLVEDRLLNPRDSDSLLSMMADSETSDAVKNLRFEDAWSVLEKNLGLLPDGQYESYAVYLYTKEAERLAADEGVHRSIQFLDSVPPELQRDSRIRRAREVYVHNYAAEIHNAFAARFNAGDYEQAEKILSEGLGNLPENSMLMRDFDLLEKAVEGSGDR
jgi:tetratricopeptide (TPR) repeat protein